MKFYEFGDISKPRILLLPGTCCHWKNNFEQVIDLLAKDFYVICASYDGFDETEKTDFSDMITETEKIEAYIKEKFQGKIHAAYGCSLGGSFVGLLIQRQNIHMNHGIIGSSDLDQASEFAAKLQAAIMTPMFHKMLKTGHIPGWMEKKLRKSAGDDYTDHALKMFGLNGVKMDFVTKKSAKNQFCSDLVTPLQNQISVPGTTIHCFYAKKMGEKYKKRYLKHFKNPHIIEMNLQHEELLICRPAEWVRKVKECTKEKECIQEK